MIKRINKHKTFISTFLLLGYISFIILTITHVHGDTFNNIDKTIGISHTNSCSTTSESQENCQICHLYSSINITSIGINISSDIAVGNFVLIDIDSKYTASFVNLNYLRGPPTNNIHSI